MKMLEVKGPAGIIKIREMDAANYKAKGFTNADGSEIKIADPAEKKKPAKKEEKKKPKTEKTEKTDKE